MKRYFFLFLFPFLAFATLNGKNDFQYWQRVFLNLETGPNFDVLFSAEVRFGDDVSKYYYGYVQGQLVYKMLSGDLTFAPGYRQIYKRFPLSSTHLRPEYSPLADLTYQRKVGEWTLKDRNRVQYLIFRSNSSHWVYRNLFTIETPWHFTRFQATPYLQNEFFIREGQGVNQDRITFGFKEKLTKTLKADVFYIARFLKPQSSWFYQTVFGMNLKWSF